MRYFHSEKWSEFCSSRRFQRPATFRDILENNTFKRHEVNAAVFVDRFRYQLTMIGLPVLIGLYRLLHAHVAYEIDTAKIISAFCQISYFFHYLIRISSIDCRVQTTRCTMTWFSLIDSDINWLCLKNVYWYSYLDSLILNMKYLY